NFWRIMLARARALLPSLVVIDCGENLQPELAEAAADGSGGVIVMNRPLHGASLAEAQKVSELIKTYLAEGKDVWLRVDGTVQEPAASIVRAASAPLVLAPLHNGVTSAFFREQSALLRHSGAAPCGVVALNDTPIFSQS